MLKAQENIIVKDTIILPADTEVDFSTGKTLNKKTLTEGYRFEVVVSQNVTVDGKVIIQKGAETMAEVVEFDETNLYYRITQKGVPSVYGNTIGFDNSTNRVPLKFQDLPDDKRVTAGEPCLGKTKRDEKIIIDRELSAKSVLNTCPGTPLGNKRLALIIGNADYKHDSLNLDNPVHDAKDMGDSLKNLNFHIIYRENVDIFGILDALEVFRDSLTKGTYDIGLVFYSGHGIEIKEKIYLVPLEANMKQPHYARKVCVEINELLEAIPAPLKVIVFDACRDNPLEKTKSMGDVEPVVITSPKSGTLLVYGTSSGKTAGDDSLMQRNGDYTLRLKECLGRKEVVFPDVFDCARNKMNIGQTPETFSINFERVYLKWRKKARFGIIARAGFLFLNFLKKST